MIPRRAFLGGTFGAVASTTCKVARAQDPVARTLPKPLVWPITTKLQPGVRSFNGHTDTVLDVVGRIGAPPSVAIFTEGNHLMALLSDDIVGAFPSWAKSQPRYADLNLDNFVVVTLPQPVIVEMIRTGGVALGNLMLDVSRRSGFYPDIFMGYSGPLRELRRLGVLEPRARYFSKNRGLALLVRKGNPLGIGGLSDTVRGGVRIALPDSGPARTKGSAAVEDLLGKTAADEFFAAEVTSFPGRLGIMHRDLPEMIARSYADVALTWYHLVSYWSRTFSDYFELVPIPGAERFFAQIAFGRVADPLRRTAMNAFDEFFFSRARDVYPRYDFARMNDAEFGATFGLD
jgi:Bacterial extracellular solute-binding protein